MSFVITYIHATSMLRDLVREITKQVAKYLSAIIMSINSQV